MSSHPSERPSVVELGLPYSDGGSLSGMLVNTAALKDHSLGSPSSPGAPPPSPSRSYRLVCQPSSRCNPNAVTHMSGCLAICQQKVLRFIPLESVPAKTKSFICADTSSLLKPSANKRA